MIKFENSIVATVFLTLIDTTTLFFIGYKSDSPNYAIIMLLILVLNILLSATIAINHKELSDKLKRDNNW